MIYLDNAATTFIKPPAVRGAMLEAMKTMSSPGRGAYRSAMRASDAMLKMRETASELFNVHREENVVFTQNATQGLNIAVGSLVRAGSRVLISGYEHNSVTRPLRASGAEIRVFGESLFDPASALEDLKNKLDGTDCVVCTHVSNVFGYVLPIYEIARECRGRGVPLIVDASQSAGVLELDASRLGAEFIAMPGHKALFGPPGSGLLICKDSAKPLLFGGSGSDSLLQTMPEYLPDRLEAGTQSAWAAAALNAGMRYVLEKGTERIGAYEREMKNRAVRLLAETEGVRVYAADCEVQSGVVSFSVEGMDCGEVAAELGRRDICVRSGLHCAPLAHRSVGTLDTGTVRLSASAFTREADIDRFARELRKILQKI